MKIDLHIHSKDCSDGDLTVDEIIKEANRTLKKIAQETNIPVSVMKKVVLTVETGETKAGQLL